MQNGKAVWLLGWLFVWAAADIRKREIRSVSLAAGLCSGVLWQLATGGLLRWDTIGGVLTGGFFWIFSCLSEERLGKGDAWAILCVGLYLGFRVSLAVLLLAFVLSSAGALYLLLVKKKPGRYAMPFIPFLAMAAAAVVRLTD